MAQCHSAIARVYMNSQAEPATTAKNSQARPRPLLHYMGSIHGPASRPPLSDDRATHTPLTGGRTA